MKNNMKNNYTKKLFLNYVIPTVLIASIFVLASVLKNKLTQPPAPQTNTPNTQVNTYAPQAEDSLVNLDYLKSKIEIADELIKNGAPNKAIEYYKTLLQYERTFSIIHFNLGKLYVKAKQQKKSEFHFKKSIEQNPKNPNAHSFLGTLYREMKQYEKSAQHLKTAIKLAPHYFDAYLQLGKTYHEMGALEKSLKYSRKATELSPKSIFPYLNMAYAYNKKGQLEKSIQLYRKVISMDPACSNAHYNLGYTLKIIGKLEEALKSLDKAIELRPDYLDAHIARSQTKISLGKFDEGWDEYEWRWGLFGIDPHKYRNEMWDGSNITGKTILLRTEQGLGDTMQFVRFAKVMKEKGAAKVICKVQKPLVKLLSNCDFIDQVVSNIEDADPYDCQAQMMSMPRILKIQPDTIPADIPYFTADKKLEKEWHEKLSQDKNFKVGICWHVDPVHEKDKSPWSLRSINLDQFAPLAKIKNITFYSLQKLDDYQQLTNIPQGMNFQHFGPDFDRKHGSFMDSAAIIKSLDLVITVDTCLAHLAGALGKPVWMFLPYAPDCRWHLNTQKTAWYPTMTMFRQTKPQSWDEAIQTVANTLDETVKKHISS